MVTDNGLSEPLASPPQPWKTAPLAGNAVRVTVDPGAWQSASGERVTVPSLRRFGAASSQ